MFSRHCRPLLMVLGSMVVPRASCQAPASSPPSGASQWMTPSESTYQLELVHRVP